MQTSQNSQWALKVCLVSDWLCGRSVQAVFCVATCLLPGMWVSVSGSRGVCLQGPVSVSPVFSIQLSSLPVLKDNGMRKTTSHGRQPPPARGHRGLQVSSTCTCLTHKVRVKGVGTHGAPCNGPDQQEVSREGVFGNETWGVGLSQGQGGGQGWQTP